ncbi:MAG: hypothetical protein ABIJ34_04625 [archaeon]
MKDKDCKVMCDGEEVATISCKEGEFSIKCTDKGKHMCKEFSKGCC